MAREAGNEEDEPEAKRHKVDESTVATADTVDAVAVSEDQEIKRVKRIRGRRGILSSFIEFPMDVVVEIFTLLDPTDPPNLARTTKEFRGILMTRSLAFVWKESRRHVEGLSIRTLEVFNRTICLSEGLPDLPRDLSEPQYANLCFSRHCHECLASPVSIIFWSARKRLCKKCIKADFIIGPSQHNSTFRDEICLYMKNLVPSYQKPPRGPVPPRRGTVFFLNPKYREWYEQKYKEMKEKDAHAKLCIAWAAARAADRKDKIDNVRQQRYDAIVERLTALGWGEEIPWDFYDDELVNQPRKLTDRIWKNIEAPLMALLHAKIIADRRTLAARVYNEFRETLPPDAVYPPTIDVLLTEQFRAIIEDTPVHPQEKLTEESFAVALLSLPELSAAWRRRKDAELVEIMKKSKPDAVEADLHLASTFFACSAGPNPGPIGYPRILVHAPATNFRYGVWDHGSLQSTLKLEAWNGGGHIIFHEQAKHNARSVLEACGLDPDVTTRTKMDELNPALQCLNCHDTRNRLRMRWSQAGNHLHYYRHFPGSWKCLDLDEERLLEARERQDFETFSGRTPHYCCKICGDSCQMSFDKLKAHLEAEHGISDSITFEQHVAYHLDASVEERHPRPIWWKPSKQAVETRST
ncbi:hypothetical protein DFH08DRAFT_934809 [Mycena albidolilacea]|uniref:F-box domain-containing protein n=1 Tax=Mycena albidolilacea TaxID=1033008 RepID=A0AAD7A9L9_9AGAR|nr:hypothetical protein DFH08DRAFT_934809 [Mycena albidolilacea]